MLILKIIGVAFVGTLTVAALKEIKTSLAVTAGTVTGIVIITMCLAELTDIFDVFTRFAENANLDNAVVSSILKIIGIGYITEYSAGVCEDYGSSSIAKTVQLGGKVSIFILALPVITGIINTFALIGK